MVPRIFSLHRVALEAIAGRCQALILYGVYFVLKKQLAQLEDSSRKIREFRTARGCTHTTIQLKDGNRPSTLGLERHENAAWRSERQDSYFRRQLV